MRKCFALLLPLLHLILHGRSDLIDLGLMLVLMMMLAVLVNVQVLMRMVLLILVEFVPDLDLSVCSDCLRKLLWSQAGQSWVREDRILDGQNFLLGRGLVGLPNLVQVDWEGVVAVDHGHLLASERFSSVLEILGSRKVSAGIFMFEGRSVEMGILLFLHLGQKSQRFVTDICGS